MADSDAATTVDVTGEIEQFVMISPEEFDESRVVIKDPVTNKFKIGATEIQTTLSPGFYLDDEGKECTLFFSAPPQQCFGVNYVSNFDASDEDKQDPSKAKGVQVQYPMTSLQSIASPTPQEAALAGMV